MYIYCLTFRVFALVCCENKYMPCKLYNICMWLKGVDYGLITQWTWWIRQFLQVLRNARFKWLHDLDQVFTRTVRFWNFSNLGRSVIKGTFDVTDIQDSCLPECVVSGKKWVWIFPISVRPLDTLLRWKSRIAVMIGKTNVSTFYPLQFIELAVCFHLLLHSKTSRSPFLTKEQNTCKNEFTPFEVKMLRICVL